MMSYLHAEYSRYHDPQNLENAAEENLVDSSSVFSSLCLMTHTHNSYTVIQAHTSCQDVHEGGQSGCTSVFSNRSDAPFLLQQSKYTQSCSVMPLYI